MSSTSDVQSSGHVIARFSTRLHAVLDELATAPAWSMTAAEQRAALVDLARAESRLGELRLRVLVAADRGDVGAESGASSTAAWMAHATRRVRSLAHADVALATRLDETFTATRAALAAGLLDLGQARVIVRAVEALPPSAAPWVRELAEKHLVALAGEHDEKALKILGRRVLEVVDPEVADIEDGKRLAAEETAAARATYLHLFDNGNGTHTGRFKIPSLQAVMLKKMLNAVTGPRPTSPHQGSGGGQCTDPALTVQSTDPRGDTPAEAPVVSRPERLGQALCELVERFPSDRLPKAGGVSASVVVLLDYEKLVSGLGAAKLDTGERISAALARRLACQAGVIPAVYQRALSGASVVLDMGRKTRFHSEHQRIALSVQQGGCTADSCDRPAGWCDAHHEVGWAAGGSTSLENGRLLCPFHHRRAHDPSYHTERLPDGRVRFHRRS
jgi:hypothetical protein